MANRIALGGEYETTDKDGNEVTRNRYWIDTSNSLMNQVNALAIERDENPREVLSAVIQAGSVEALQEETDD